MQINSHNLRLLGLSLADAFDACHSIASAARLIQLFSRYNTGSPARGIENGYAMKVVASIGRLKGQPEQTTTPVLPEGVVIEDTPATGELFFTTKGP
jgi:type IV secretion system protein VirB1